ncbi:DUF2853 family protein [Erythrobacter sp. SDW2]|uniref:DUF2853 family protein n=1 Tax=Erythrobacter sp. SDW2 TaxID=2907154 RepID=UPI001F1F66B7|nr:DUF2853 family protein [Erythrobacter sp. SDW2]UIP07729.1 DUF2853 family protein [Erythrobacter sp. SDW2]
MDQDWLAHVRTYVADADEVVVKKIVNYCGIALRKRDTSLVSFADPKETARVRDNFLRKKLALTDDDATLDSAIAGVGERMKGDSSKNRVTVYYLLAEHFDMLDLFGGTKTGRIGGSAAAAPVGGSASLASMPIAAAAPEPPVAPVPDPVPNAVPLAPEPTAAPVAQAKLASKPSPAASGGERRGGYQDDGIVGMGCLALAVVVGGIAVAALLAYWISRPAEEAAPPTAPVAALAPAAAPADTAEPAVPDGAGVVAGERDGTPMVTTYFESGKTEVSPEFAAAAAPVLEYLKANPDAKVAISGFNDPSGDATANAELSKNRAQAVQAALVALGVDEGRTDLVRPDNTTTTAVTPEQARRVELMVVE